MNKIGNIFFFFKLRLYFIAYINGGETQLIVRVESFKIRIYKFFLFVNKKGL